MSTSDLFGKRFEKIKQYLCSHIFTAYVCNSLLLTLVVETLCRKSLQDVISFITGSFFAFLCNFLIILFTLTLSGVFGRRRYYAQLVVNLAWLILGVINSVVLTFRMTPISAEDIHLVPMAFRIAKNYLTGPVIAGIIAVIVLLCLMMVVLWVRMPRDEHRRGLIRMICGPIAVGLFVYLIVGGDVTTQAISQDFQNLAQAYENYGFAYCFSNSIVDVGIDRPEGYDYEAIEAIGSKMMASSVQKTETAENKETSAPLKFAAASAKDIVKQAKADEKPDIIMVQLESFADPTLFKGYQFSDDPAPVFRSLKESCPSGRFTVPVVGAGTANSEFEVLTGMSCDFFGTGEYPYNTILQETTVESLPYLLKQEGYVSTVIHNNTGTFYKRDKVFSNLGFDVFIPEEYMYDLEYTPTNWAKDEVLTDLIIESADRSEAPAFIYTITVQSHGRYPAHPLITDPKIRVTSDDESVNPYPMEYYANQVRDVDEMIGDLVEKLEKRNKPVILVMYGDHLPALGFTEDDLDGIGLYQTEYVIWTNTDIEFEDRDIESEEIGGYVLDAAGYYSGILAAFRNTYDKEAEDYAENLQLLEYDMLYGEGYIYDLAGMNDEDEEAPSSPYEPSDLSFGIEKISLSEARKENDELVVTGENFNEHSRIMAGEKILDTIYIDRNTLRAEAAKTEPGTEICVVQCDSNQVILGDPTEALTLQ